jgi:DNA repair protein RadC
MNPKPGMSAVLTSERPRERLLGPGADAMRDVELLAVVLGTGTRGRDVLSVAAAILERFGELRRVAVAGVAELAAVPGVGRAKACRVKAALALATRLGQQPFQRGEPVGGPADVHARVGARLRALDREVFVVLALDVKNRVLAERRVAEGGACSVQLLPRDLFAQVVREAAAGMICVHNHPSGDPRPSAADEDMTRRLRAAGELMGVAVVDHVIVGYASYYSFADGRETPAPPGAAITITGLAGSTD